MSVKAIQDRLQTYACRSALEEEQALREITQEIVLAALGRTDFFQKAAFQGGTCLRVFHGIERFSEDLDFATMAPRAELDLKPYLDAAAQELAAYGYGLEVDDRSRLERPVRMAFVKDDSLAKLLRLDYRPQTGPARKLRIKIEVDTNPPPGASFEVKHIDFPFLSAVTVFDLPSLFAGKLHALLCRDYLKGRDWYDFIWYTSRRAAPNYVLLSAALDQIGPWRGQQVQADRQWCAEQLGRIIEAADWPRVRDDVRPFVKQRETPSLDLWDRDLFLSQLEKLV